jgi:hypothetical protein
MDKVLTEVGTSTDWSGHLAAGSLMYIVCTAMHIPYTLHLLLDPRRIFEMGLTLTHLPINPLIE